MHVRSVILCGGSGSRLWPLSRSKFPKQFIPLFEDKSLFDLTLLRSLEISTIPKPIIITSKDYFYFVKRSLEKLKVKAEIFIEPEKKNTTAAIYLAAKAAKKNENLLIMPSDHLIPDNHYFANLIKNIKIDENFWVTFGIKPTSPSEAYGYINVKTDKIIANDCYYVNKFVEKPNENQALEMMKDSSFYWNSGIFLAKKEIIINSINLLAKDIAISCDELWDNTKIAIDSNEVYFNEIYFSKIRDISIDYSVMEKTDNIIMVSFNSIWSDVGSWDTFADNLSDNGANLFSIDSRDNFIMSENKIVATIGLHDTIVVDTEDCLRFQKRRSQKSKEILKQIGQKNKNTLIVI